MVITHWASGLIYLILDNLSAHKKAWRELTPETKSRIRIHWLPTNSSWLNLIEPYFGTLARTALDNTYYRTPDDIEQGLLRGVQYLNANPRPYVWKKI